MPRTQLAYAVNDVSEAARSIRDQLSKLDRLPSHVEVLNMLARAAGFRNFQHYRAGSAHAVVPPQFDEGKVDKVARYFGAAGRLQQWPSRQAHGVLCLWVLWSRLPRGADFTEAEIGEVLDAWHTFGYRALLRRALVDHGLVDRTVDGGRYTRIELAPPPELVPLLARITAS
jgi:hypothetical protein